MGEDFEQDEQQKYGQDGFEQMVSQVPDARTGPRHL